MRFAALEISNGPQRKTETQYVSIPGRVFQDEDRLRQWAVNTWRCSSRDSLPQIASNMRDHGWTLVQIIEPSS